MRLRSLAVPILGLAFLGAALPATAQSFDPAQRKAIEAIVKDYLVRNPEVLQEAFGELEKRQQDALKASQATALRDLKETLAKPGQIEVGNPRGTVSLVEFFDYNCGYCKRALSDVHGLTKSDPRLRIVLKDLPVLGPESVEASRVSLGVSQQISGERMFDYHTRLLASRGKVDGARAVVVAKEMGLDMARLQRDTDGAVVKAALAENGALGEKLGINGTPAFIVGEEVISGAVGLEPLRLAVTSVRKCGQASC